MLLHAARLSRGGYLDRYTVARPIRRVLRHTRLS